MGEIWIAHLYTVVRVFFFAKNTDVKLLGILCNLHLVICYLIPLSPELFITIYLNYMLFMFEKTHLKVYLSSFMHISTFWLFSSYFYLQYFLLLSFILFYFFFINFVFNFLICFINFLSIIYLKKKLCMYFLFFFIKILLLLCSYWIPFASSMKLQVHLNKLECCVKVYLFQ